MHRPPIPDEARLLCASSSVRQIRTSKPDVLWLQGPGPIDFWTWVDLRGAIQEQELTFFGRTVIRRHGSLMTGLCQEGGGAAFAGRMGLLEFDSQVDPETLRAGDLILSAVPGEFSAIADLRAIIRATLAALDPAPST